MPWDIMYCMDNVGLALVFLSAVEFKSDLTPILGCTYLCFVFVIPWCWGSKDFKLLQEKQEYIYIVLSVFCL